MRAEVASSQRKHNAAQSAASLRLSVAIDAALAKAESNGLLAAVNILVKVPLHLMHLGFMCYMLEQCCTQVCGRMCALRSHPGCALWSLEAAAHTNAVRAGSASLPSRLRQQMRRALGAGASRRTLGGAWTCRVAGWLVAAAGSLELAAAHLPRR